ncbi:MULTISPECIES: OmpA family protein [unclassified Fusibacter]|uniref:OmpA family protein n=1 Tax=unclassified Fusibacter TaxID=2624464 RepID=UPI001011D0FC|nr:OmpA family protein [Fusibacter sp. A1]MCK8060863.1 OmpA family protein [Fusibacter sp. A2]NPE23159.1 OmpA family protein [Fusibacter sp. A1]RXV59517.1 hypothetical protein DWB64_15105 [Fusibacter sp. A1]
MSQYRITTRGKIVIGLLIVMLFIGSYLLIGKFIGAGKGNVESNDNPPIDTQADLVEQSTTVQTQAPQIETTREESVQTQTTTEQTQETTAQTQEATEQSDTVETTTAKDAQSSLHNDEIQLYKAALEVYFKPNETELTESITELLDDFIFIAKDHPELPIRIVGHTLNKDVNSGVAEQRANTIAAYLVSKGVAQEAIHITYQIDSKSDYSEDEFKRLIRADVFFENFRPGK